jgi:hypothetical protein
MNKVVSVCEPVNLVLVTPTIRLNYYELIIDNSYIQIDVCQFLSDFECSSGRKLGLSQKGIPKLDISKIGILSD